MLRALIIRQALTLVDLALAACVVFMLYLAASQVFAERPAPAGPKDTGIAAVEQTFLRTPPARNAYQPIVTARLYGPASELRIEQLEEMPVVDQPLEALPTTTAPLTLMGTMASRPKDPFGVAVIQDEIDSQVYYRGQEIRGGYVLDEIHRYMVVLRNPSDESREVLRSANHPEAEGAHANAAGPRPVSRAPGLRADLRRGAAASRPAPARQSARPAPKSAPAAAARKEEKRLSREELGREIRELDLAKAYADLSPHMVQDDQGNTVGLTAQNIDKYPLARKLGFQKGDVVTQINGFAIDSEQRALEVINRSQNNPTQHITILRNGQEHQIVLNLN